MVTPSHLPALEVLIERCEAAQGPDEHIDCLVWQIAAPDQRVMFDGGKAFGPGPKRAATYGRLADFPLENWSDWHAVRMLIDAPPVTSSIDAALALTERLLPGLMIECGRYTEADGGPAGCFARISNYAMGDGPRFEDDHEQAATLPLAIILATLQALRSFTKLEG
jgi:hypothetical protein